MTLTRMMPEELGNIAPEVDLKTIDPEANLREALDINSWTFLILFLQYITALASTSPN